MDNMQSQPKMEQPNLPPAGGESQPDGASGEQLRRNSPEVQVVPLSERSTQATSAVAQAISGAAVPQAPPVGAATASDDDDDDQASPAVADDNDVIEKEWVDRAKAIMERTRGDPFERSSRLTYLKKDYIHRRFDKIIKVPQD